MQKIKFKIYWFSGSSGPRCEEDIDTECNSKPCKNGGICQNLFGNYKCICAVGFTGTT